FDPVLRALHKGAGRMAGDVDPPRPILQRYAKSAWQIISRRCRKTADVFIFSQSPHLSIRLLG
ncbi:MAG TPA: hypothetical protein VF909_17795, partial [Roseiflexaceae bacterium]